MPRPNVLFLFVDQMKATASHLYGSSFCRTPGLERLANHGVLFEGAHTPHPLCVPARVSLMTGRYPHAHGARRNETWMPPGAQHAFRIWKSNGYRTGFIGKNHCFETADDLAQSDVWCEIGHRGLPDDPSTKGMDWVRPVEKIRAAHATRRDMPSQSPRFGYAVTDYPLEDYSTGLIAAQTVRFLEEHGRGAERDDEPFALFASFPDPHAPYEAPRYYADQYPPDAVDLPPRRDDEFGETSPQRNRVLYEMLGMAEDDETHIRRVVGIYHAMVRFIDDGVTQILDALDGLGLQENTIVVFTADHGDFAGEHGMMGKGGVFYDSLTRVPLLMSWPERLPFAVRENSMVNTIDILPALLELQGIEAPRSVQGQPLPTVTSAAPRDAAFSEYGAGGPPFTLADLRKLPKPYGRRALMRSLQWREAEGRRKMVRTHRWKYVHDPMGDLDELYDLQEDPWELRNVAADPAHGAVIAEMKGRLPDWSIETEDARFVPLPASDHYGLR